MKRKIIYSFVILIFAFAACDKQNVANKQDDNNALENFLTLNQKYQKLKNQSKDFRSVGVFKKLKTKALKGFKGDSINDDDGWSDTSDVWDDWESCAEITETENEDGSFKVFSPFYVPTLDNYDLFETHVGLGYQKIVSEFYGIRTECTIFVPTGSNVVVRDYKITNVSDKDIEFDLIPVIEYTHPDALKQFTNADWIPQTMCSEGVQDADDKLVVIQYPWMNKKTQVNYFTTNGGFTSSFTLLNA